MSTHEKLLDAIREHSEMEDSQILEAGQYGADAGWPGFTYTTDAVEFYENNEALIYELLIEVAEDFGYKNVDELVSTFNRSDMLSDPDNRKNLLAWFALEEVGRWLDANPRFQIFPHRIGIKKILHAIFEKDTE